MPENRHSSVLQTRIKERLQALGLSARAASLRAGLGPDAIRTILSGRSAFPRADRLSRIAAALDTTTVHLLGVSDNPTREYQSTVSLIKPFEAVDQDTDLGFAEYWHTLFANLCYDYVVNNVNPLDRVKYERLAGYTVENNLSLVWVGLCSALGRIDGRELTTVVAINHIVEYLRRDPAHSLHDEQCRPYLMLITPHIDTVGQDTSRIRMSLFFRLVSTKAYLEAPDVRAGRDAVLALFNDLALAGERRDYQWMDRQSDQVGRLGPEDAENAESREE